MRIIYLSLLMALPSLVFAQIDSTSIATAKTHVKKYISGGISIGNVNPSNPGSNTFSKASYASIEGGIVWKNATLGLVLGPENFFATSSTRMCYELKTTYSVPIEQFSVYGLFGTGAYFEKKFNNYIEYGAGVAYSLNSFSYFVQYSNWASCNYVNPLAELIFTDSNKEDRHMTILFKYFLFNS